MTNIKTMLVMLLLSVSTIKLNAQVSYIPIAPIVDDEDTSMGQSAKSYLKSKLSQIVLQNGLSAGSTNCRFVISAKPIVVDKNITATAPALFSLNIDLPICIGDGFEGLRFAHMNLTLKGVGSTEEKAIIDAIKGINVKNTACNQFIVTAKKSIIEYYNNNCDIIIAEAKSLESQNQFDAAIAKLNEVPNTCKECYVKTLPLITTVYQKYKDSDCKKKLNEAEVIWAANPTIEGAGSAADILSMIDSENECYKVARVLLVKINATVTSKMNEAEKREWDLKYMKEKAAIEANQDLLKYTREIALAYANNQPKTVYHISDWFK